MYATAELEMVLVLHQCIYLLEAAVRKFVHCGRKGTDMVNNNTQVGYCISMMLS